ncbi:3500_t:CDS:2 [Funneliformis caledonium]|uniref:3500_t:CDS:1 n=1 Tax=Funneliformis caledonium TaxID=1117310 RepID=A0A9N9EVP6_9GLOM|nr:3500_t:CDS:2 [Funneliformis caledonium]
MSRHKKNGKSIIQKYIPNPGSSEERSSISQKIIDDDFDDYNITDKDNNSQSASTLIPKPSNGLSRFANLHLKLNLEKSDNNRHQNSINTKDVKMKSSINNKNNRKNYTTKDHRNSDTESFDIYIKEPKLIVIIVSFKDVPDHMKTPGKQLKEHEDILSLDSDYQDLEPFKSTLISDSEGLTSQEITKSGKSQSLIQTSKKSSVQNGYKARETVPRRSLQNKNNIGPETMNPTEKDPIQPVKKRRYNKRK